MDGRRSVRGGAQEGSARADFGLLHFAAHAVADEERPERSAVLLAPGGAAEDGLLQSREIVDLPLDGRVVVLSACRSAGGSVLRGEGVLSLARAFFQAGSPAVVGSLWPLRDDETATLFESFYRHLARGLSLGAACGTHNATRSPPGRPRGLGGPRDASETGASSPFREEPRAADRLMPMRVIALRRAPGGGRGMVDRRPPTGQLAREPILFAERG